jgi:carboxymethylenebutenolidase
VALHANRSLFASFSSEKEESFFTSTGIGMTTTIGRRVFVMSTLLSGFTTAVARAQSSPIHTDSIGLTEGEVKIPVADGALPAYRAQPQGAGPFPIIVVIEEIFGVHEYIKDVCRRLAKLGYLAVAPELYARIGDPSKYASVQAIVQNIILKAPDETMLSDLSSTASWAGANGGDIKRLGVTGFCRGGRDTWLFAEHDKRLKAAVAWYGPVKGPVSPIQPHTPTDDASALVCPLLGLYGGQDSSIHAADLHAAAQIAIDAGHTVDIKIFPDAGHGFHADYRDTYNRVAAEQGWQDMLAWFKKYGVA